MEKLFSYVSFIDKQLQYIIIHQNPIAKMMFSLLLKPAEQSHNILWLRKKLL